MYLFFYETQNVCTERHNFKLCLFFIYKKCFFATKSWIFLSKSKHFVNYMILGHSFVKVDLLLYKVVFN